MTNQKISKKTELTKAVIPNTVSYIDYLAFRHCYNLVELLFDGTSEEWSRVIKDADWNRDISVTYVQCNDGRVML